MPLPAGITVVIRDTSLTHSLKQYGVAKEVIILFYSDRIQEEKPSKTNTFFAIDMHCFTVIKCSGFLPKFSPFIWYIS